MSCGLWFDGNDSNGIGMDLRSLCLLIMMGLRPISIMLGLRLFCILLRLRPVCNALALGHSVLCGPEAVLEYDEGNI